MNRRNWLRIFFTLVSLLSLLDCSAKPPARAMNHFEIGPWVFALPTDWQINKKQETVATYFESADRSKGCYIRSLQLAPSSTKEQTEIAAHIQSIYKESLEKDHESKWRVMQEKSWLNGDTSIAVLDLLDHDKKYRVLSKVLAYKDEGVQFTLHDYNCEDYATSVRYFSSIAESLRAR